MKYKKIIITLLTVLMVFFLSGCRAKDYKLATRFFEEGDYKRAESFFETANKYKDSLEKVKECKYYVAKEAINSGNWEEAILYLNGLDYLDSTALFKSANMHINSDYAFLDDLEKLLVYRFGDAIKKDVEAKELYKNEYDTLKKYELSIFFDTDLKKISNDIISGLKEYSEAYDNPILSESQYHIYNANSMLSDAYAKLYNQYDFLASNDEFIKTYVNTVEQNKTLALASSQIKADIDKQGTLLANTGTPWTKNRNSLTWTISNNTDYSYTLRILVTFYDDSGNSYYTDQAQAKMKPGASQEFKFTINSVIFNSITYDYIYQDIF